MRTLLGSSLVAILAVVPACGGDDNPAGADAPPATPDAPTAQTMTLKNVPSLADCAGTDQFSIAPVIPQETGHLAAGRLAPPSYPFEVESIGYDLAAPGGSADCDLSLPHRVDVYVASGVAPSNTPSVVQSFDVPAGSAANHSVDLELASPITLTSGQSLFVAVEMAGNGTSTTSTKAVCIAACRLAAGALSDVDYWSNAAATPYAWADMVDDFGFTYNYTIRATGTAR